MRGIGEPHFSFWGSVFILALTLFGSEFRWLFVWSPHDAAARCRNVKTFVLKSGFSHRDVPGAYIKAPGTDI